MYRLIVERRVRRVFAQLGAGDYQSSVAQFPPHLSHHFPGEHALGGTRHTPAAMRRWFERLFAIFPDLHFEIRAVLIRGWPWHTIAAIEWTDRAILPDGSSYENDGVHIMHLRWGRVVSIRPYLDTQAVADACARAARGGVAEGMAAPIGDESDSTAAPSGVALALR